VGAGLFTWVLLPFVAGALDRVYVLFGITYSTQLWAFRVLVFVLPLVVMFATKRVCEELLAGERVERIRKEAEREGEAAAAARHDGEPVRLG
jgi:hypothetical protein